MNFHCLEVLLSSVYRDLFSKLGCCVSKLLKLLKSIVRGPILISSFYYKVLVEQVFCALLFRKVKRI